MARLRSAVLPISFNFVFINGPGDDAGTVPLTAGSTFLASFSSPSSRLTELTMHLPGAALRPASRTIKTGWSRSSAEQ